MLSGRTTKLTEEIVEALTGQKLLIGSSAAVRETE